MRRTLPVIAAMAILALAASCGRGDGGADAGSSGDSITVFAAASLTDAFGEVAQAFERAQPGVSVDLNFAGSSALREQILAGAPADVFASANMANMEQLVAATRVAEPMAFATNRLQIAVPPGNPGRVAGLADFADAGLLIGLCAEEVPCGAFARQALASAGVEPSLDTSEPDVRALLTKIEEGELDAGIVYTTDVISAGSGVEGIDIPERDNVVATYPIATVVDSGALDVARQFVDFVLGDEAQAILQNYGFDRP